MTKALVIFLILATGCGGWRTRDTAAQTLVLATFTADHSQTVGITRDCLEGNAIMGRCGEHVSPDAYFLLAAGLHTLAAAALPPRWRSAFQTATIGRVSYSVGRNWHHGYAPFTPSAR